MPTVCGAAGVEASSAEDARRRRDVEYEEERETQAQREQVPVEDW